MGFFSWCIERLGLAMEAIVGAFNPTILNVILFGLCLYLWFRLHSSRRLDEPKKANQSDVHSVSEPKAHRKDFAQKELMAAQLRAAQAQTEAAEAELASSRMRSSPFIVPALEYDYPRARFDLVLRNAGMGVALKAAWSISPAFEADLDQFIWPREARLVPIQRGSILQAITREGDWSKTLQPLADGDYLVLVNYLDLLGNLWQTQLLTNLGKEDAIGEQGYAVLFAPEFQRRRSLLEDPTDPMETGLHPWWIPKREPPERKRPHVVSEP